MFLHLFFYGLIMGLTQLMSGAEKSPNTGIFEYTKLSYQERKDYAQNAVGKKLFDIMESKKTNLAVALDVGSLESIVNMVTLIGPSICLLKIHAETLPDFFSTSIYETELSDASSPFMNKYTYIRSRLDELIQIANYHNFLIMEDRKFSDIGNTVEQQYTGGIFKRATWSDLVTAHALSGGGMIQAMQEALKKTNVTNPRGVVMLPQMSTKDNLLSSEYTVGTLMQIISLKKKGIHLPAGMIVRSPLYFNEKELDYGIVRMTPGVGFSENTVADQQYITPQKAFCQMGTDIAIVGRAIYNAKDPVAATQKLQELCWSAYSNRLQQ